MGNLLQYTNKGETIDNKLTALLAQIQYDYNNGVIRTETEYYYRIKNMLADFYRSLTKPTFKFRPAISTPMSDEYNAMITESYNDMAYIIKDCETLNNLVSQSFVDAELGRKMMSNEVSYLTQKVNAIISSVASNQPYGTVVFTELFSNAETIGNSDDIMACNVDTEAGILTLGKNSMYSANIDNIYIDPEVSNGFPGNTHCIDTLNNELHFIGRDGLRNNIACICDSKEDTWFEYELFSITESTKQECNSYGFEYNEGVSWVNNEDILRLKLIIYPTTKQVISWITLKPYVSDIKGVKNCFVESCDIITTANNSYRVGNNIGFDDVLVFPFPPHAVQRVELVLVQPSKYLTKVGHVCYTLSDTTNMSIFQNFDEKGKYTRVDGSSPSVSLLGCKYNPTTKWIEYPDKNTQLADEEYCKDGLFNIPPSTIDKKSNHEIIDAYRYMIGIRSIKLTSNTFEKHSEYVSTEFTTDDIITSVTLEANEYIPGNNPEDIKYFISLDSGITWHKIYPIHRAYQGTYKYYVNNDTIENLLNNQDGKNRRSKNLSIIGEPKKIKLKITMDRPTSVEKEIREYCTPIVYDYKLKLTTGGETIEY